jgi:hypothetical protein
MGISGKTIAKYRIGNPEELCHSGMGQSKLDAYREAIFQCLYDGYSKSKTVKYLYSLGYSGAKSTVFDYLLKIERYALQKFTPQSYVRTRTERMKYKTGSKGENADYLTRAGIFQHFWMHDKQLTREHRDYIFKTYPQTREIQRCIQSFRHIFIRGRTPSLWDGGFTAREYSYNTYYGGVPENSQ